MLTLTGNLPGVVTTQGTGMPGEEEPKITIRGASSWNNNEDPLVLVDGIERPMSSVDISSVTIYFCIERCFSDCSLWCKRC